MKPNLRTTGYIISFIGLVIIFSAVIQAYITNDQYNRVFIWLPLIGGLMNLIGILLNAKQRTSENKQIQSQ